MYLFICEREARNSSRGGGKHTLDARAASPFFSKGKDRKQRSDVYLWRKRPLPRRRPVSSGAAPPSAPSAPAGARPTLRPAAGPRTRSPCGALAEALRQQSEPFTPARRQAASLPPRPRGEPAAEHLPPEGKLSAPSEPWPGRLRL